MDTVDIYEPIMLEFSVCKSIVGTHAKCGLKKDKIEFCHNLWVGGVVKLAV